MAEHIQETKPPEPPPKPREVPNPVQPASQEVSTEQSGHANESQQSAQQDARHVARFEHEKAIAGPEPPGLQPTPKSQASTPEYQGIDDDPSTPAPGGEQSAELASVRQAALSEQAEAVDRTEPTSTLDANTETDASAETATRLSELRDEGHGPQRHHDPTDEQLAARMGEPIIDSPTGQPELKPNGHVKAQNHIDPMTGSTADGVNGGTHRCGDYATRFDSADDYVDAEHYMRNQVPETGPAVVKASISDVLGPDGHERLTGFYRDPGSPADLKPVDFAGGQIVAVYNRAENGDLTLYTMYPDPVPFHPSQSGGA